MQNVWRVEAASQKVMAGMLTFFWLIATPASFALGAVNGWIFGIPMLLVCAICGKFLFDMWFRKAEIRIENGQMVYYRGYVRLKEGWRIAKDDISDLAIVVQATEENSKGERTFYKLVMVPKQGRKKTLIGWIDSKHGAERVRESMFASLNT
jgi:hypothetical protein